MRIASLSRRYVVERTFSGLGHNRRLGKDFENLPETLGAFAILGGRSSRYRWRCALI
jgi:hypothetical protein